MAETHRDGELRVLPSFADGGEVDGASDEFAWRRVRASRPSVNSRPQEEEEEDEADLGDELGHLGGLDEREDPGLVMSEH